MNVPQGCDNATFPCGRELTDRQLAEIERENSVDAVKNEFEQDVTMLRQMAEDLRKVADLPMIREFSAIRAFARWAENMAARMEEFSNGIE